MTPTTRETLGLVANILDLEPHIRIGQLMAWTGDLGGEEYHRGLWDLENEELHALLKTHLENLRRRLQEPMPQKVG